MLDGLARVSRDHLRQAFAEDLSLAEFITAAQLARMQFETRCDAVPRQIGDVARVVALCRLVDATPHFGQHGRRCAARTTSVTECGSETKHSRRIASGSASKVEASMPPFIAAQSALHQKRG